MPYNYEYEVPPGYVAPPPYEPPINIWPGKEEGFLESSTGLRIGMLNAIKEAYTTEDALEAQMRGYMASGLITWEQGDAIWHYVVEGEYVGELPRGVRVSRGGEAIGEKWSPQLTEALKGVTYDARGEPQMNEATALEVGRLTSGMSAEIQNMLQGEGEAVSPGFYRNVYDIQQAAYEKAGITGQMQGYERTMGRWGVGGLENIERKRQEGLRPEPLPSYTSAFEEARSGLTGTQRWRDWYESKYSSELSRFRATTPTGTAEQKEESWAEFLRKRKPELKEEFYRQPQYQRGLRPSAFAPRIKTVGF